MKKIVIQLPKSLPGAGIEDFLRDNLEDLYPAMDLEVQDVDDRATLDNVEIDSVSILGSLVTVNYRVDFSAYHGCRDMNYDDYDSRSIAGKRIGDRIEFDEHIPLPQRSTHEEF